jgi:hypothetical protein
MLNSSKSFPKVAIRIFRDAIERAPGGESALSEESFHRRLTLALWRLSAARSAAVVGDLGRLLIRFPDKTHSLVTYLMAIREVAPGAVVDQVEMALLADEFKTGWLTAHIIRVLWETSAEPSVACVERIRAIAGGEVSDWLCRAAAAHFLATRGLQLSATIILDARSGPNLACLQDLGRSACWCGPQAQP